MRLTYNDADGVSGINPRISAPIVWTDLAGGATAEADGTLTMTSALISGWGPTGNGGAASVQTIEGDGAVEFEAPTYSGRTRALGLSNSNTNAHVNTIGYAILADYNDSLGRG